MSSISTLRDKVDGKLEGTLGVFISASGYSEEAPDALTRGKKVNVILWDRGDLDELFLTDRPFLDILNAKLRRAAEEGLALVSMRDAEKAAKPALKVRRNRMGITEALRQMRGDIAARFVAAAANYEAPDDERLRHEVGDVADAAVHALRKGSTWDDAQAFKLRMQDAGGLAVALLQTEEDMSSDGDFLIRHLRVAARRCDNIPPPWELWLITLRYYTEQLGGGYFREESLSRICGLLIEATIAVDDWDWAEFAAE